MITCAYETKSVHLKQSVKCFLVTVMSITWAKYGQDTDKIIRAVVVTEIMEVLVISACIRVVVNCFSKNDWKNTTFFLDRCYKTDSCKVHKS